MRLRLILTSAYLMKLTPSQSNFSSADLRFALGAVFAVAVVMAFILSIHIF